MDRLGRLVFWGSRKGGRTHIETPNWVLLVRSGSFCRDSMSYQYSQPSAVLNNQAPTPERAQAPYCLGESFSGAEGVSFVSTSEERGNATRNRRRGGRHRYSS